MPQCIFCENEDLPEETQECPDCGNKPFSGMYFDREQYTRAEALEAEGKVEEAWALLYEEWMAHCDVDYFDDEMADELKAKLLELFDRQPSHLVQQRYELYKQTMEIQFFWACFASEDTLKEGMKAMLKHGREDLARELVSDHAGLEGQGRHPKPPWPTEDNITSYIERVRKEMEDAV
jgi:hypothetical protein